MSLIIKKLNMKRIAFNFPVGSALIKTFYYPVDEKSDLGMNLLETRLLLRKENGCSCILCME